MLCEDRTCNAEIVILKRFTEKGRQKFFEVNAPGEKRWVAFPDGAKLVETYTAHVHPKAKADEA